MMQRMRMPVLATIALVVALVFALLFWQRSAPPELVDARIVSSQFQSERAADGRTVTTVETADGRRLSLSEPGRRNHEVGRTVRAELRHGTLVRLSDG